MNRRRFIAALFTFVLLPAGAPLAQTNWPERPVHILVPAPGGSSLDVLVRTIGDKLRAKWGQAIVVDNKPSASGTVATAEVARAAPDGHTLLMGFNGPLATGPLLTKVPYDVDKDLLPVVITSSQPNVLAVNAQLPIHSVKELVAYAKANPGKLNFASVGNGSSSHLNAELLNVMAGIGVVHVPFNGSPPAVLATVQGETHMIFAVMQPLQPHIQGGKLRAIAVTTAKRFPLLPDLPAIAETYPGFEALAWNGILAPAGTPPALVQRINADINAAMKEPDVIAKMNGMGFALIGGSPGEFAALIKGERERWVSVIKKAGIKAD